jgi:hypothetical protein
VYGLIFLFKYRSGEAPSASVETDSTGDVFFASQVGAHRKIQQHDALRQPKP